MKKIVCALLIGRKGSKGLPGKNMIGLSGHPMAYWPLNAARNSKLIDRIYVSTDDPSLKKLALDMGCYVLDRPNHLAVDEALGEDVFIHAAQEIKNSFTSDKNMQIEFLVLLMANAPTIDASLIDEGITLLRQHHNLDSAVSVSKYNMWSPIRARKINTDGLLEPFIPFNVLENYNQINCDRDSQGDVYFADMGVSVIRPTNLDNVTNGMQPQRWMGSKIFPLINNAGLDVDYEYQLGQAQWWINNNIRLLKNLND
jgi:CMP-N-acetylneuraminic acid synthetase